MARDQELEWKQGEGRGPRKGTWGREGAREGVSEWGRGGGGWQAVSHHLPGAQEFCPQP